MPRFMRHARTDLLPTEKPHEVDVAWAAGFWEGEGSVCKASTNTFQITATQKNLEPLLRLRQWFGGSVTQRRGGLFSWQVSGPLARQFVPRVWPYLSARRREQLISKGGLILGSLIEEEAG